MAIEKARPIALEIAQKMGVKITGIHAVSAPIGGVIRTTGGYEFEFAHYASSADDVAVRANVTVSFACN